MNIDYYIKKIEKLINSDPQLKERVSTKIVKRYETLENMKGKKTKKTLIVENKKDHDKANTKPIVKVVRNPSPISIG